MLKQLLLLAWLLLGLAPYQAMADTGMRVVQHRFLASFGNAMETLRTQMLDALVASHPSPAGIPLFVRHPPQVSWLEISVSTGDRKLLTYRPSLFAGYITGGDAGSSVTSGIGHLPQHALNQELTIHYRLDPEAEEQQIETEAMSDGEVDALLLSLQPRDLLGRDTMQVTPLKGSHAAESGGLLDSVLRTGESGEAYVRGGKNDPRLAAASTRADTGMALEALADLLALRERIAASGLVPAELHRAIVRLSIAAGLLNRAARHIAVLPATEPATQALHLDLATAWLQRGDLEQASRRLNAFNSAHAPMHHLRWQDIGARILLDARKPEQAAAAYKNAEGLFYEASRTLNDPLQARRIAAYSRYNRAIAFMRSGNPDAGRSWLDIAGRAPTTEDPVLLALRDKANTSLGWSLLRDGHGLAAMQVFGRVRLDGREGPYALLGTGWALLRAPSDDSDSTPIRRLQAVELGVREEDRHMPDFVTEALIKRRVLDQELYGVHSLRRSFGQSSRPDSVAEGARLALPYWRAVLKGNIASPPEQEAMVAIGLAWQMAGDEHQAASSYRAAIAQLERVINAMPVATERIRDRNWRNGFLLALTDPQRGRIQADTDAQHLIVQAALADDGIRVIDAMRQLRRTSARTRESDTANREAWLTQARKLEGDINHFLLQKLQQGLADQDRAIRRYLKAAYAGWLDLTANQAPQRAN